MRFRLTLQCEPPQYLPFDYQYLLAAWIYKTFNEGDPAFAAWLHNQGYTDGNHQYKLFTFSWLRIPEARPLPDQGCLAVYSPSVTLIFSVALEEAAETFIKGLFQGQDCVLGNRKQQARFQVTQVEKLPAPDLGKVANFSCLSPLCLSKPKEVYGKLQAKYLSPEDSEFEHYLFKNLVQRYQTAVHYQYEAASPAADDFSEADPSNFSFTLKRKPKSKLVNIKPHASNGTKVRGYYCTFQLKAPDALMQFAYDTGLGEKGSLGFGCVSLEDG